VGGSGPGSYSTVTYDIYAEGIRISPVKLYREGEPDETLFMVLRNNTRNSRERMGDLRAQLAGCWTGEQRVQALAQRYGAETLSTAMEEILDHSEALTRAALASIPKGTYRFVDYCDGDGVEDSPIKIAVTVTVDETGILADFTGSSRQTRGGMNCPLAVTASATCYAIKCITDPANPANSGNYRPVRIQAPAGSVLNCLPPAPVIAGNHETASRIADAVLGALAQAVPDRVSAAGCGSAGILCIAGEDERPGRKGRHYICVECHGGGQGAAAQLDGAHAIRVSVGNTGNTPVESLEIHFPVLVERYEIIDDSGGPGQHRGGCGLRRHLRLLDPASVIVTCDRAAVPPYGLLGGRPGRRSRFAVDGREVSSKTPPFPARRDAVVEYEMAGGGGFGDPFARPPERVREDAEDGFVSPAAALEQYGVVLAHHPDRRAGERYSIDEDATRAARARRRS
jgi:N-methylhydantoinase B